MMGDSQAKHAVQVRPAALARITGGMVRVTTDPEQ